MMNIIIDKEKKLSAIHDKFQKRFPFFKIEFYKKAHSQGEGLVMENTLNNEMTIEEVNNKCTSGIIKFHGQMTVAELENTFARNFGLSVQVFRKSGNVWLQSTVTDDLTLTEQNQLAEEKYDTSVEPIPDPMDRQELE